MTPERQMIVMAVFEGKLTADHITMEELEEVEELVFDLIAAKHTPYDTFEVIQ